VTRLQAPRKGWLARYRDGAGREHSRVFSRERDALAWRAEQLRTVKAGTWTDPSDALVTFREYAEGWLARVPKPSSRRVYETRLRLHIYPDLGDKRLRDLRHSTVDTWRQGVHERLAPATAWHVEVIVRAVLNAAVADRALAASPFARLKLDKLAKPELGWLPTPEDVLAVADGVPARYRALVVLAADTGLRCGELLGLTVAEGDGPGVAPLAREVRVYRQLLTVKREEVDAAVLEECGLAGTSATVTVLGPPKTRASRRVVGVSEYAVDAVAEHLAAGYAPEEVTLPVLGDHRAKTATVRLLFQGRRGGGYLSDATVRTMLRRAGAELGLPLSGPHVFRHYYASVQIEAGRSLLAVSRALGHASTDETERTYGHLFPEADELARGASAAAWDRATASRPAPLRVAR
jgi:integrase